MFNDSPYNIVAKAGVGLANAFTSSSAKPKVKTETTSEQKPDSGTGNSSPSLFADDQARRLSACRVEIVDGWLSFGHVRLAVGLARYRDDRFRVVLLSYVWQHHHNLRAAMVSWLQELSKDPRPIIGVRAAQVTGLYCSLDFHFTFNEMIGSAVDAEGEEAVQRRLFAAVAMDQAARDERISAAISGRLRYWRRWGSDAEKWTAAATLGYDLGRRSIDSILEELRVLGTPSEQQSAMDDDEDGSHASAAKLRVDEHSVRDDPVPRARLLAGPYHDRREGSDPMWMNAIARTTVFFNTFNTAMDLRRSAGMVLVARSDVDHSISDSWSVLMEPGERKRFYRRCVHYGWSCYRRAVPVRLMPVRSWRSRMTIGALSARDRVT